MSFHSKPMCSTPKSKRVRGVTIIEMTLTLVLTAIIVAAATTLYSFIAIRTADAVTRYTVLQNCTRLSKAIEEASRFATKAETKTIDGKTFLVITVPDSGVDRDGDGEFEIYAPSKVNKLLRETFSPGRRIWFYRSNGTGSIDGTGVFWFKAERTDDENITSSDIDRRWSFWSSGNPKTQIPGTVTFSIYPATFSHRVTIQTTSSGPLRKEDAGLARVSQVPTVFMSCDYYWRGSR